MGVFSDQADARNAFRPTPYYVEFVISGWVPRADAPADFDLPLPGDYAFVHWAANAGRTSRLGATPWFACFPPTLFRICGRDCPLGPKMFTSWVVFSAFWIFPATDFSTCLFRH